MVRADGTFTEWYPFDKGFGQGFRGVGLYYNSSSECVPSLLDTRCSCHVFADDKMVETRCEVYRLRESVFYLQKSVDAVGVWCEQSGLTKTKCLAPQAISNTLESG